MAHTISALRNVRSSRKKHELNKAKKTFAKTSVKDIFSAHIRGFTVTVVLAALRTPEDSKSKTIIESAQKITDEEKKQLQSLVNRAYKAIDAAVGAGVLHQNNGAHKKGGIARKVYALLKALTPAKK